MDVLILLFRFGGWEILIIAIVVLLLFGGRKIPELMRGLGKGIREFKDGVNPSEEEKNKSKEEKKTE
ncbi:MAG: twin-arginine translocase TatA/TatE family subunit [Bacteroidales bacterium]|nr:twin-arginine translocase TatA/TatE family subunit [Bacteroidales bacterium]MCF8386453.1 twin-arginine translocase TatA/TatE family subunit [Bacteroidales bacterium]MCF8397803.1 twin-arginine translocase TatA/TatE family subunit [Bacteroidales bacterium]